VSGFVLIVEDEKILAESMRIFLERHGYATAIAHSGEEGVRLATEVSPDVAVMDLRLPGIDGLEALKQIRETAPGTEVIMVTAHGSVSSAVEAMRRGAFHYLSKPVDLEELRVVIDKAQANVRVGRELTYLRGRGRAEGGVCHIVGDSSQIHAVRKQIEQIAALALPEAGGGPTVLIQGETGTGKELVARALHYESPRAAGPFVEINCTALPTTLLEAELFGYERGAYTDAKAAKAGLFEAAEGGTLFLDEIGHMDMTLQVKLLKAIEDKSIRRVGALRPKSIDVRIVAATNRDLESAIAEGEFRQDLYFRIKVLTIELPPLRAREGDVLLLARHFLEHFAQRYGRRARTVGPEAETLLQRYQWPGNVRELAHVMERATVMDSGTPVRPDELGISGGRPTVPVVVKADRLVEVDFSAGGIVLEDVERQLIIGALRASDWNRGRAADLLAISRDTLRYRMEKFQLQTPS
jgi:two-component system, NtrC family, response regulator AtoC